MKKRSGDLIGFYADAGYQLSPEVVDFLKLLRWQDHDKILALIKMICPEIVVIDYHALEYVAGEKVGYLVGHPGCYVEGFV